MWSHPEASGKDKPSFPSCGDPGGSGLGVGGWPFLLKKLLFLQFSFSYHLLISKMASGVKLKAEEALMCFPEGGEAGCTESGRSTGGEHQGVPTCPLLPLQSRACRSVKGRGPESEERERVGSGTVREEETFPDCF